MIVPHGALDSAHLGLQFLLDAVLSFAEANKASGVRNRRRRTVFGLRGQLQGLADGPFDASIARNFGKPKAPEAGGQTVVPVLGPVSAEDE